VGRGCCGTNLPTEVVEIATLCEFDKNDGFFTTSCDPYMGHTFRLFVYTFHPRRNTIYGFKKMPKVIIKLDKMLKD
jgi:hypothetical protein